MSTEVTPACVTVSDALLPARPRVREIDDVALSRKAQVGGDSLPVEIEPHLSRRRLVPIHRINQPRHSHHVDLARPRDIDQFVDAGRFGNLREKRGAEAATEDAVVRYELAAGVEKAHAHRAVALRSAGEVTSGDRREVAPAEAGDRGVERLSGSALRTEGVTALFANCLGTSLK
jgi:hypothetical protein